MAEKEEGVWSVVEMEVEEASRSIQMPLRSGAHVDIGKGARVEDAVREAAVAVLTASSTRMAISARESRTPRSSPPGHRSRHPSFSIHPGAGPGKAGSGVSEERVVRVQYGVGLRPSFTLEAGLTYTLEAYSIYHGNSPGS